MRFALTIASLAAIAHSATQQYCTGFEGPFGGFTPSLKVTSQYENTSVLVFHIFDLLDKYRATVDLDVLVSLPEDVFGVAGVCGEDATTVRALFDAESVLNETKEFEFKNVLLSAEESVQYDIPSGGIYCAYVHQDTDASEVEGVEFETKHLYGYGAMTSNYVYKLFFVILFWLWFVFPYTRQKFPNMHGIHWNEGLLNMLMYGLLGKLTRGSLKMMHTLEYWKMFGDIRPIGFQPSLIVFNKWILIDHFLSLLTTTAMYRILTAVLLFKKGEDFTEYNSPPFTGGFIEVFFMTSPCMPIVFGVIQWLPLVLSDSAFTQMLIGDFCSAYFAMGWCFMSITTAASFMKSSGMAEKSNCTTSKTQKWAWIGLMLQSLLFLFSWFGTWGISAVFDWFLVNDVERERVVMFKLGDVRDSYLHMLTVNYIWNLVSSIVCSTFWV